MDGFAGEFVPPGAITDDFKRLPHNMAEMAQESERISVTRVDGQVIPVAAPARTIGVVRALPRPNVTTSTDPVTCLNDRIAQLSLELAQIEIEIARRAGIRMELKQLRKALEAFDVSTVTR